MRRLEYLPLDEIEPAPRNPKRHATDAIRASIDRFSYVEPVVIDERTGRLVAGHGRIDDLAAREEAGEEAPDGIQLDGGRWLVPVVRGWASRDDAEAEAYLLASNRLTEAGGWDDRALASMLEQLAAVEPGLEGIGFSQDEFDALLASVAEPVPPGEFPDVTAIHVDRRCPRCGYEWSE